MILCVLYILASLDGVFCGFRTSAGRCALIRKTGFYVRGMLRGFAVSQLASVVALAALFLAIRLAGNEAPLIADLKSTAARMVVVFLSYASLVMSILTLRLIPSVDIRSATSVIALGPLTAMRPMVMIAGTIYGTWVSTEFATKVLAGLVLVLMLSSEWFLNLMNNRIQRREIEALVPLAPVATAAARVDQET